MGSSNLQSFQVTAHAQIEADDVAGAARREGEIEGDLLLLRNAHAVIKADHVAEAAGRKAETNRVLMLMRMRCYKLTSDHVAGTAGREAEIKNIFNVTAHMCACAVYLRRSKTIFLKIYLFRYHAHFL